MTRSNEEGTIKESYFEFLSVETEDGECAEEFDCLFVGETGALLIAWFETPLFVAKTPLLEFENCLFSPRFVSTLSWLKKV